MSNQNFFKKMELNWLISFVLLIITPIMKCKKCISLQSGTAGGGYVSCT